MLGLALLAAGLAITGWLALLAGLVFALVQNNIVSWWVALGIAALLSFAGAGGFALMIMRRGSEPLFAATRRQLGPRRSPEIEMNDDSLPLVPHEQEVEESRMAAHAEYQVLRQSLHRRLKGPLIIGGGMLAGIAVGYLVRARRHPKYLLALGHRSAWTRVLGSVQVLTPLLMALRIATRPQASAASPASPATSQVDSGTAGERHES